MSAAPPPAVGVARILPPFLLGFDVFEPVTEAMVRDAWGAGFRWCGRYLNNLTAAEAKLIHSGGLAILPYTEAMTREPLTKATGHAYGISMAGAADALDMPAAVHVAIDLESPMAGSDVAAHVNAMAQELQAGGGAAALYVGVPQPLSGPSLFALRPDRYIKGGGFAAEPPCGWAAVQLEPLEGYELAGVKVDVEVSKHDYQGRSLMVWWPR